MFPPAGKAKTSYPLPAGVRMPKTLKQKPPGGSFLLQHLGLHSLGSQDSPDKAVTAHALGHCLQLLWQGRCWQQGAICWAEEPGGHHITLTQPKGQILDFGSKSLLLENLTWAFLLGEAGKNYRGFKWSNKPARPYLGQCGTDHGWPEYSPQLFNQTLI